jgi:hypothetical protein
VGLYSSTFWLEIPIRFLKLTKLFQLSYNAKVIKQNVFNMDPTRYSSNQKIYNPYEQEALPGTAPVAEHRELTCAERCDNLSKDWFGLLDDENPARFMCASCPLWSLGIVGLGMAISFPAQSLQWGIASIAGFDTCGIFVAINGVKSVIKSNCLLINFVVKFSTLSVTYGNVQSARIHVSINNHSRPHRNTFCYINYRICGISLIYLIR